jgi:hypothetical protein
VHLWEIARPLNSQNLAGGSLFLNLCGRFHWTAVNNMIFPTLQELSTLAEVGQAFKVAQCSKKGFPFGRRKASHAQGHAERVSS